MSSDWKTDITYASKIEKIVAEVMLKVKISKGKSVNTGELYGEFGSAENLVTEAIHEMNATMKLDNERKSDTQTEWILKIGLKKVEPNVIFYRCIFNQATQDKDKMKIFFEGLYWKICNSDYLGFGTSTSAVILNSEVGAAKDSAMSFRYDILCHNFDLQHPDKDGPEKEKSKESLESAPKSNPSTPIKTPRSTPSRSEKGPSAEPPKAAPASTAAATAAKEFSPKIPNIPASPFTVPAEDTKMCLGPKSDLLLVSLLKNTPVPNYKTQSRLVASSSPSDPKKEEWIAVVHFG